MLKIIPADDIPLNIIYYSDNIIFYIMISKGKIYSDVRKAIKWFSEWSGEVVWEQDEDMSDIHTHPLVIIIIPAQASDNIPKLHLIWLLIELSSG